MQLLTLLTLPLIVRVLGPSVYGKWVYAQTMVGFFALLANPGLTVYGLRQLGAHPEEAGSVVPRVISLMVAFGTVSYLLLCAITLLTTRDQETAFLMMLYGVVLIGGAFFSLEWALNGLLRFDLSALFSMISSAVYAGGVFLLLRRQDQVWVLPVVSIAGSAVGGALGWRWLRRSGVRLRPLTDVRGGASILGISTFYFVSTLMSMLYNKADHLMLSWVRGDDALGQYGASYKLMGAVMGIILSLLAVLVPYAARASSESPERFRSLLRKGTLALAALSLPLATGGSLLAPEIAALVLGPAFKSAGEIFRLLAWNIPCGVFASFFAGSLLYATGHHRRYVFVTGAAAAVNILLNLALIPIMGATGAAITTILAQLTVVATSCYLGRQYMRNVISRSLVHPVLACAVMAGGLSLLTPLGLPVIATVAAGTGVYLTCLMALDRADGRELLAILASRGAAKTA